MTERPKETFDRRRASVAMTIIVVLAVMGTLRFTRTLFLPIVFAVLIQFMLQPLVRLLRRVRVPPSLGAGIVLMTFMAGSAYAGYSIHEPALKWARELPEKLQRVEYKLGILKEPVEEVTRATEQVEEIAKIGSSDDKRAVRIEKPPLVEVIATGLGELAAGALIGLVLTYFLLSQGDWISEKLNRVLPQPENGHTVRDGLGVIQSRISRYLLTITGLNVCLGIAVGSILFAVGMPNPILWGTMACVLNFVPYLGSMVGAAVVLVVGLVTFEPLAPTLIGTIGYAVLSTVEGLVVTPMVLGYRFMLSPVVIFLWLLLWNWVWGIPGVLIAVPVLVMVKILSESYSALEPLRTWLE